MVRPDFCALSGETSQVAFGIRVAVCHMVWSGRMRVEPRADVNLSLVCLYELPPNVLHSAHMGGPRC
jgi:hypothetical protein